MRSRGETGAQGIGGIAPLGAQLDLDDDAVGAGGGERDESGTSH